MLVGVGVAPHFKEAKNNLLKRCDRTFRYETPQSGNGHDISDNGDLMKVICFLTLAIGVIMATDGLGNDDPAKGDLDKLKGTWLTA